MGHADVTVIVITCFILVFTIVKVIQTRWIVPVRGFWQLALLIISELTFFCNKGLACEHCPLSFGVCPVGATQRLAFINYFPVYATLLLIGVIGIIFGTLTCGWACPIGFIQDLFAAVSPVKNKIKIPGVFKRIRFISLLLLGILIVIELRMHYFSSKGIDVLNEVVIFGGFALLAVAFIIKRPFCKGLCPLGLVYGGFNKISLLKVSLNQCRQCKVCLDKCVADINPVAEINNDWCVKCCNCRVVCEKTRFSKGEAT